MHRISVLLVLIGLLNGAFAEQNTLKDIKVIPLENKSSKIEFHFHEPLKEKPSLTFSLQKDYLNLQFLQGIDLDKNRLLSKKIELNAWSNYTVRFVEGCIQVSFGLSDQITYLDYIQDKVYTLVINKKNTIQPRQTKEISLNFQNIKIRSLIQLLAEFSGENIIVSEQVKGDTTLSLNNIAWEKALDIIIKTHALKKNKKENILYITPNLVQENKEVKDRAPLQTEVLQINYAKASDIADLLKDKISSKGKMSKDDRTNIIWIQDTNKHIKIVKKLVAKLDVPVRQVLIEARIVSMSKSAISDLGVKFGASKSLPKEALDSVSDFTKEKPINNLNIDFGAAMSNPVSMGFALAKLGDGILLDLELSALESENKAKVIARPKLMTTNQKTAIIESGEEVPYQEAVSNGTNTVAFKKAVLSLKVTPQITLDNKLLMRLRINQDSISARHINGVPAILTKEIQTNVLVNNGQTVVLGGIYKQDEVNSIRRMPLLGDLPILGILFSNKHREIKNEELLIFITPKIIPNFPS